MCIISRVAMGTLCGGCDIYDACVKKMRFKGKFDFTYVSDSQVIVKKLEDGSRTLVKSNYGCEITKLNVFRVLHAAGFSCGGCAHF
jgi:intraflagellar transport protein 172